MRETWGGTSEVSAGELESDMVALSLVMNAQGSPGANFNAEARRVLGERGEKAMQPLRKIYVLHDKG